ncbi:MAG: discoidin domain-containing protein [Acidimicrobiales bacterium]
MTYKPQGRHARHAALGTAIVATLAIVSGFLVATISPALAATTTTATTTTTTPATTTTTAPPTTTTTAVPGSNCVAATSGTALGRTGWVASTNAPSSSADAPAHALDGNLATRFSTNADQAYGIYLEVSLGRAESFYALKMGVPNSPTDYARDFNVDVSNNGTSWATIARCTGTTTPETISFVPQTVNYLKVVLTSAAKDWWSVDELNLFGQTPATTTTTAPGVAHTTASLGSSANPATVGEAITYTAKVLPATSGGTVNFFNNGAPVAGCNKVALNTSGEATCTATYFSGGHQGVQAFYSGQALFGPSTSAIYAEVVNLPAPGYWLATGNGQVFGTGAAQSLGGVATSATTGTVVGIAASPSAKGYWVVTANGGVSAMGDAKFYGDLPDLGKHVSDVVAIAPTSDGLGYYLVGADGGFFTFGDAKFHGSLPGIHIRVKDVVGMVASPGGGGYLLVGSDGGVFTFGATHFYGSLPGLGKHVHDIRAILPSSTGLGYILVGADGGAFNFGSGARFHGSLPGEGIRVADIVGLALSPDNGGYLMAGSDGRVYGFGDAQAGAMPAGVASNLPVAAIAGT